MSHAASPPGQPGMDIIQRDVADMIGHLGDRLRTLSGASILVTGASGMMGGYLADVAASLNASGVLDAPCFVHLATRRQPTPDDRLGHLLGRDDVRFVQTDGQLPSSLPSRADVIIHAASPASPRDFLSDPIASLDANSTYLRALLELFRRSKGRAFLYVSSSEVYGDPPSDSIPTSETYVGAVDQLSPRASYSEAKRFGEALCMAFHRQHGLPITVVRPFHVHGPGQRLDDGRIVAELIRVGLTGEAFTLSSDGSATRCYGYISDAVEGMYAALLHGGGEAFNIGVDGPETSILQLATMVSALIGGPPPRTTPDVGPVHLAGAPRRSRPDLTKARSMLRYSPRVSLRGGLERTIAWHRSRKLPVVAT